MTNHNHLSPKVVLAIGAHPDDTDFTASGTVAKWSMEGATVHYLVLTDGGKGSADTHVSPAELTAKRRDEQRAAAKKLGVAEVHFLDYEDGRLELTMDLKRDVVRFIRQIRPDVVLAFDPTMVYAAAHGIINHPDHRACGQAVLDATYPLARDHLSFPELFADGYQPHKVKTVLLTNYNTQDYFVDITGTIDKKLAALASHGSQMPPGMVDKLKDDAAKTGKQAGYAFAEGFVRIDLAD